MQTPDAMGSVLGWLALAVVLVALVEIVPASNRPLTWGLGLILVYLVLTNAAGFGRLVDRLVGSLG